jgi:putative ABC transport system permease protein
MQAIFVTLDQAQTMLEQEGFVTFFLLQLKDPDRRDQVAPHLEALQPGILAITSDDFAAATRERILGNVIPILTVILVLAFIVGLAVAGLTIYTATVEKAREYGILKAVGFTNRYLYRVVFEQSLVIGLLGFFLGVGLTLALGPFAQDIVPQFVIFIRWQDLLGVAGITLLIALLAAYVPVRRLAAIDPVTVFKA